MRPTRCFAATPDRLRLPALILGGVCLLALASSHAYGAEFGSPQVLVDPDPLEGAEFHVFGRALALDRKILVTSGWTSREGADTLYEVFIYGRQGDDPSRWRLRQRLSSDEFGPGLGKYLALDRGTLVVSTNRRLHVFWRGSDGRFRFQRTIRGGFPGPLSLEGDRLAVGVPHLHQVRIFERHRFGLHRWGETPRISGKLTSPVFQGAPEHFRLDQPAPGFGRTVALGGDRLAVGAVVQGVCCGKGGPDANSIFVFARDEDSPSGWKQLHNFEVPGRRGTQVGESDYDNVPFGEHLALSGPVLLAGEGFPDDISSSQTRVHLYERNHRGPDSWGYRRELRRARRSDQFHNLMAVTARGNTAAVADLAFHPGVGVRIFERDFPSRDRWGLKAHLPLDQDALGSDPVLALGSRELVVGGKRATEVHVFPRRPILADGFENGTLAAWVGRRGAVEVVSPGLGGSDSALAVRLGGGPSFVASGRPRREPSLTMSFTLHPNGVKLARQRVEILRLFAGKPTLRLSLEESDTEPIYRAVLEVRRRNGEWQQLDPRARILPGRENRIVIEYRAATDDSTANGAIRLEANGYLARQAVKLDVGRAVIGRVVLGLPVGSPAAASGSLLIDDFELHR